MIINPHKIESALTDTSKKICTLSDKLPQMSCSFNCKHTICKSKRDKTPVLEISSNADLSVSLLRVALLFAVVWLTLSVFTCRIRSKCKKNDRTE